MLARQNGTSWTLKESRAEGYELAVLAVMIRRRAVEHASDAQLRSHS
jgi:hypothetical protein